MESPTGSMKASDQGKAGSEMMGPKVFPDPMSAPAQPAAS
jgi:hypothetical protein